MSVSRISTTSYLAVTCSVFAFRVQYSGLFWVLTSENVPLFSAYWFNTGYMSMSVYGGFWYFFTYFLRQGGPRIPVLCNAWFDSGLHALRQFSRLFGPCPCCARRAGSHGCPRGGDSRAPTVAFVEKFLARGSSSTR